MLKLSHTARIFYIMTILVYILSILSNVYIYAIRIRILFKDNYKLKKKITHMNAVYLYLI